MTAESVLAIGLVCLALSQAAVAYVVYLSGKRDAATREELFKEMDATRFHAMSSSSEALRRIRQIEQHPMALANVENTLRCQKNTMRYIVDQYQEIKDNLEIQALEEKANVAD